jgi:hypothetical protein
MDIRFHPPIGGTIMIFCKKYYINFLASLSTNTWGRPPVLARGVGGSRWDFREKEGGGAATMSARCLVTGQVPSATALPTPW